MAKININFNNKNYSIDEAALSAASTELKSHLSTVMNGSGATINFGGTAYDIDSTKLSSATTEFVSHLDTIAGSGAKVVIGGVEYGIDSTKVSDAVSQLEAAFGGVGEERLEGDGAEYYTLAPTALSFRSTAPLNELQDVQINGVTVDPSNYTLEEGSTIVTFPIDYLKTLDIGNYEVTVASDSKTVKGDFTVAAPELNGHGFYYNQPYTAYISALGYSASVFVRTDGTLDIINLSNFMTETCSYEVDGNNIVAYASIGTLHNTISTDGTNVYCNELATTFQLGDESIAADEDYIYIYKEDLGGYEVQCIDKTKAEYGAIKTGINGNPTVAIEKMFLYANDEVISITIPEFITSIGESAFVGCVNLKEVHITSIESWCGISFVDRSSNPLWANQGYLYLDGKLVTDIAISENVIEIKPYAFDSCTNLMSIELPDSVTSIGEYAFFGCYSLTSIELPDSVTSIGEYAFMNCSALDNIIFSGTTAQWNAITKVDHWNHLVPATYVQCSDGQVAL